jgi:hypothetical protein
MTHEAHSSALAHAYVAGVRQLITMPSAEQPQQADALLSVGRDLNRSVSAVLHEPDTTARLAASTQLLAKALTDLDIGLILFETASATEATERSAGIRLTLETQLELILSPLADLPAERGPIGPDDLPAAQLALTNAAVDALKLITARSAEVGQQALKNLGGLAATDLARAAGATAAEIAVFLGVQQQSGRIYQICRDFFVSAYEALVALIGAPVLKVATDQFIEWMDDLRDGKLLSELLAQAYAIDASAAFIREQIRLRPVPVERLVVAALQIGTLDHVYGRQVELVERFLKRGRIIGNLLAAAFPQLGVFLAGLYAALGSYAILTGADFVDAPGMLRLDRVPGVKQHVAMAMTEH